MMCLQFAVEPKELDLYLKRIPRTFFLIADYPEFEDGNYSILRFASYEIWNQSARAYRFRALLEEYYRDIYLAHIAKDPNKTPAPKNFWPYSYQFYLCNPIKTFECVVRDADTDPKIEIKHYVEPKADRSSIQSENMPVSLLSAEEKKMLEDSGIKTKALQSLDEKTKDLLPLRDTSFASPQKNVYHRR